MKTTIIAVAVVVLLGHNCCGAVLDQAYLDEDLVGVAALFAAQSFTAGITGTLTRVELRLGVDAFPESTFSVLIRSAENTGFPEGANLGGITVQRSELPAPIQPNTYFSLDFTPDDIQVVAGERMAIVLDTKNKGGIAWGMGETLQDANSVPIGGYSGGLAFLSSSAGLDGTWVVFPHTAPRIGLDFNFRTFVQPIPEPSTLALAALALLGLVAHRHRRRIA